MDKPIHVMVIGEYLEIDKPLDHANPTITYTLRALVGKRMAGHVIAHVPHGMMSRQELYGACVNAMIAQDSRTRELYANVVPG